MKKNEVRNIVVLCFITIIVFFISMGLNGRFNNFFEGCSLLFKSVCNNININNELENNETLLGINEVEGSGVIININDGSDLIHQEDIIILINEIRNTGCEAISVNNVRITNQSYLYCDGGVILLDGVKIGNPFNIRVIGDIETIYGTLTRNKGYINILKDDKIIVDVEKQENVKIEASNLKMYDNYKNKKSKISKIIESNKYIGKTDVEGRGVEITIDTGEEKVLTSTNFIEMVNDLKSANVTAISINNQRITNMTDIVEISKKYILVNSINIKSPFIIRAVGDIEKIQNAIEAENSMFAKLKEKGLKYNVEYKKYIKVYKYEVQKEQDKMQIKYMKKI